MTTKGIRLGIRILCPDGSDRKMGTREFSFGGNVIRQGMTVEEVALAMQQIELAVNTHCPHLRMHTSQDETRERT